MTRGRSGPTTLSLALLTLGLTLGAALAEASDRDQGSAGVRALPSGDPMTRAGAGDSAAAQRKHCRHRRYRRGRVRRKYKPTPRLCPANPIPARIPFRRGSRIKARPVNGPYSPPPGEPAGEGGDEESEERVALPAGRFVPPLSERTVAAPQGAEAGPAEATARSASAGASAIGDIQVVRNRSLKLTSPTPVAASLGLLDGSEQSVAKGGNVVLYTMNTGAALSLNGGYSFSSLDPEKVFPALAGGFCCDQVVTYIPRRRRFVWVLQYFPGYSGEGNRYAPNVILIATATAKQVLASKGTAWDSYAVTPRYFGFTSGRPGIGKRFSPTLDRPHIAFTRSWLYLTTSIYKGEKPNEIFLGSVICRIPVAGLGENSFRPQLEVPGRKFGKVRPAQNAASRSTTQFLASLVNSSRLNVFEWPDGGRPLLHEIDVPLVAKFETTSRSPSGADWMERWGKQAAVVETGARTGNSLVFGWMTGRSARFAKLIGKARIRLHDQPALQFVFIDLGSRPLQRSGGTIIEFENFAAALPQLRANTDGALALSFVYGGPTRYASHAVGFIEPWANALTVSGAVDGLALGDAMNPGPFEVRFGGDYLGLATDSSQPRCFIAAGAASKLNAATGQGFVDPHYIVFGRRAAGCRVPPFVPPTPTPAPDLIVPGIVAMGEIISIGVRNTGQVRAEATKLEYATGGPNAVVDVPALDPGAAYIAYIPCPTTGTVTVTARADSTNLVVEGNEDNNQRVEAVSCVRALPDLVVGDVTFGNDNTFTATILNLGSGGSAPSQLGATFHSDGAPEPEAYFDVPGLAPGSSATITGDCPLEVDDPAVVFRADALDLVEESNEANNSKTAPVECRIPG